MNRLDEIVEVGRRTRKPISRTVWIASGLLGLAGLVGFALIVLADPAPVVPSPTGVRASSGGFGLGLVVGGALGLVVGFVLARQRSGASGHSARKTP